MASDAGPRKLAFTDDAPHHWIRATWEGMALDAAPSHDLGDRRRGGLTMRTVRLTTAQAIVRYLTAQRTLVDGEERPLLAGVFGIFGHGNVTCLGEALYDARDVLPTYRGQSEQGMALAAIGFAKAMRRRQFMAATSSVGPGAMNMVTAAAVAHANRLPLLLLAGDTFHSRIPDPVLQQVEHFDQPSRHASTTPSGRSRATGIASRARRRSRSRCRSRSRRCSTRPTAARPSSGCRRTSRPRPTTIRCGCSSRSCTSCAASGPTRASSRPPSRRCAAPRRR